MSYDGTDFFGFQQQVRSLRTVEGEFKKAFETAFGVIPKLVPAGRTDRGVHALGQVISFKFDKKIDPHKLKTALNSLLPVDLRIVSVEQVPDKFHARFSSQTRTYYYYFSQVDLPPFLQRYVSVVKYGLDFNLIEEISTIFCGTKDFINFRSQGSTQSKTIKTIIEFTMTQTTMMTINNESLIHPIHTFKVKGDGFLYKMVRNMVGASLEVLRGKRTLEELRQLLSSPKKNFSYTTAPAAGLWLMNVEYSV